MTEERRPYLRSPKLHLSPADDISAIKAEGLLTAKDHRKVGRIWLCDWYNVPEVAEHLTRLRNRKILRWACYSVRYWNVVDSLRCHKQRGIYFVTRDIPAVHLTLESTFWVDLCSPDLATLREIEDRKAVTA